MYIVINKQNKRRGKGSGSALPPPNQPQPMKHGSAPKEKCP